jgi:hypothetical protein
MATRAARVTQADLTRAVKGCERAGLRVGRVEITANGTITIITDATAAKIGANPWDEVMSA